MGFNYIDAHSHIQENEYDSDREEVITELAHKNIATIVVGVDCASSKRAVELAHQYENVFACVGQHPTDTDEAFDKKVFEELAMDSSTHAIGECGLDYFRVDNHDEARKTQMPLLEMQIALAVEAKKPLMIHARPSKSTMDAYCEIIDILKSAKREHGDALMGNIHFFVGGVEEARAFLDIGFTISYTAVLTFTHEYDEVVQYAPLHSILAETDSPYVAPPPNRGKRNTPLAVIDVVKAIARIRDEDEDLVRRATVGNTVRVFSL